MWVQSKKPIKTKNQECEHKAQSPREQSNWECECEAHEGAKGPGKQAQSVKPDNGSAKHKAWGSKATKNAGAITKPVEAKRQKMWAKRAKPMWAKLPRVFQPQMFIHWYIFLFNA